MAASSRTTASRTHDTLGALTQGREWIDQQWLGQLAAYGVETAGGVRLLLALNVGLVAGALVAAGYSRGDEAPARQRWRSSCWRRSFPSSSLR